MHPGRLLWNTRSPVGRLVMNVRASREQGNLSDPLWSLPYLQPLSWAVRCTERSFSHTGLVSWSLCTARCWAPVCIHVLHLLQGWEVSMLPLIPFLSSPSTFSIPTHTLGKHTHDLQRSETYRRGSESSIKGTSVQLYSGVKTALGRTPSGLSPASITMQHTSEAQGAAMQSHYTGTGALTHTH